MVGLWLALVATNVWLAGYRDQAITLCVFKRLTTVPCPGCGSTRAVLHLIHGRLGQAFAAQPLALSVAAGVFLTLVLRVIFARRIQFDLTRTQRRIVWGIAAGLLLVNWAYVIVYVG